MTPILQVRELVAGFGSTTVLRGVSFDVQPGSITALLGLNGAGKSVTLKCISGLIDSRSGSVTLDGQELLGRQPEDRVGAGLGHVLQARALFPGLTVDQNLRIGGATLRGRGAWKDAAQRVYATYPALAQRRSQLAGTLSGGEQEMLAVGRAMMTSPRLLLVDEPTAGLSPIMVSELLDVLRTARDSGATMLLVEQNVVAALRVADQVLVLEKGIVVYSGAAGAVDRDRLAQLLGIGPLLAAVSPPQRGSGNGRRGNVNGAHTRKEVPAT